MEYVKHSGFVMGAAAIVNVKLVPTVLAVTCHGAVSSVVLHVTLNAAPMEESLLT